jgi:hypothetical protein
MPSSLFADRMINELLRLAGVPISNAKARRWMKDALAAAQAIASAERRPSPTKYNAPLKTVERAAGQVMAALDELRGHLHAHVTFCRFLASKPDRDGEVERADVMSALENIRHASRKAFVNRIGRPRDFRKQHIVDLALAFWARFATPRPSSDVKNSFVPFAERFYEFATGLSVDKNGHGIKRQIAVALKTWPVESVRAAAFLNKTDRN